MQKNDRVILDMILIFCGYIIEGEILPGNDLSLNAYSW